MHEEDLKLYWNNYLLIEEEFRETLIFVALDEKNFNTYSLKYIKLILQLGSEIDNSFKLLCSKYSTKNVETINGYYEIIINEIPELIDQRIKLFSNSFIDLEVFKKWNKVNTPSWWRLYQKIKHDRTGTCSISDIGSGEPYYKYANLYYAINMLGALFIVLMYLLKKINEDKKEKNPYKTFERLSRMFYIDDDKWKRERFSFGLIGNADGKTLTIESITYPDR